MNNIIKDISDEFNFYVFSTLIQIILTSSELLKMKSEKETNLRLFDKFNL